MRETSVERRKNGGKRPSKVAANSQTKPRGRRAGHYARVCARLCIVYTHVRVLEAKVKCQGSTRVGSCTIVYVDKSR